MNRYIMNFLSIDFSTDIGSLFIKFENKTFIKLLQSDKSTNDLLMKQIIDLFKENKLKFNDISQIYVNQGPGNFSGLRGSLAIAKGICISKKLNLFGYNTFIWSCIDFFNKEKVICSLIKFREKYYIKRYDANLSDISKVAEISEENLLKKYSNACIVIPKSNVRHFSKRILKIDNLNIVELDHAKLEILHLKGLLDKDSIKPLYLS